MRDWKQGEGSTPSSQPASQPAPQDQAAEEAAPGPLQLLVWFSRRAPGKFPLSGRWDIHKAPLPVLRTPVCLLTCSRSSFIKAFTF